MYSVNQAREYETSITMNGRDQTVNWRYVGMTKQYHHTYCVTGEIIQCVCSNLAGVYCCNSACVNGTL